MLSGIKFKIIIEYCYSKQYFRNLIFYKSTYESVFLTSL